MQPHPWSIPFGDSLLAALGHPVVATLLLALGALGLLAEAREPGPSLPGAAGLLALACVLLPALAADGGGWPGLVLLAGGAPVVTRGVRRGEVAVATAGILLAAAGVAWVLAGAEPDRYRAGAALASVASALLLLLLAAWGLWWRMPASRRPDRVGWSLAGPVRPLHGTGAEGDGGPGTGSVGRAATPLEPEGHALFGDARVPVVSRGAWISEGATVRVVAVRAGRTVVEGVAPPGEGAAP